MGASDEGRRPRRLVAGIINEYMSSRKAFIGGSCAGCSRGLAVGPARHLSFANERWSLQGQIQRQFESRWGSL